MGRARRRLERWSVVNDVQRPASGLSSDVAARVSLLQNLLERVRQNRRGAGGLVPEARMSDIVVTPVPDDVASDDNVELRDTEVTDLQLDSFYAPESQRFAPPTDVSELVDERTDPVSEARPILGSYAVDDDSLGIRASFDDELGTDGRASAFDDDAAYGLPTPLPQYRDSDRPTNPPKAIADALSFVFALLPALPSDLVLDAEIVFDAEIVEELPSEFDETDSGSSEPSAVGLPPAAASRIVVRDLDALALRPMVTRPELDDAFDIVAYAGEVPAARVDSFGDVLDAALALG